MKPIVVIVDEIESLEFLVVVRNETNNIKSQDS